MNKEFKYKDTLFHLNDNRLPNGKTPEYEGKYTLLMWHEGYEKWICKCTVDSKKEAVEYVKRNYLYW